MSEEQQPVSRECVEQLHTWVFAHCPCALEQEPQFLPGLIVIVEEEEVGRALKEACWKWMRRIGEPYKQ